ncbi:MAG: AAA family ATPase [Chloroflexi bacterium]|nr:AAA family ATPase [Chloroflexota bacterium]
MVSQSAKILVGRQREMAELNAALDCAMAGHGRLVMLAGEPGIGKTRIAQELAGLAEQRGARVLWGWCYEQEGAPPYWPWVQPVRSYISATEPDRLRAEMGPGAADIAEVIPEVRGKLPDLEPPPALDPNQARFRLFDSFATLFKNAAESQPLMLVLDDLHWADKPSLLLLEFLARQISESSLLIVGTYRDAEVSPDHPLFGTLAQLSRDQSFRRQVLTGLPPADVGEFILTTSGANASQELIETLYADTEGNPFFMNEVIRLLVDRGELGNASVGGGAPALAVPQGVLEVIGQRLNRLSKECNDLLTTAAVIGRQFDFNLLGILSEGATELELVELVEEALQAQIIQGLPEAGDRYQFSHALVQQTLLERLSTRRRVRLHAKVGEALETLYGEHGGDHAAELAYHFAEAEPVAGPDKLVKYTMLAGERALEAYAHEEALGHFQRGLIAKGLEEEGAMPVPDAEAAALLFGLGRAQAATLGRQQLDVAFASLNRAFDFYAETNDVGGAIGVAEYPMLSLPGYRSGGDLVARALQPLPKDSPEAGRLLSRHVLVKGLEEGDYQGAMEAFDSAAAIALRTGDVALEMRTLAQICIWLFGHSKIAEAIEAGKDLHAMLGASMLNISYEEFMERLDNDDEEAKDIRQGCKISNYGMSGGMGPDSFVEYARGFGVDISLERARELHQGFRVMWPEMIEYFAWCSRLSESQDVELGINQYELFVSGLIRGNVGYTQTCNTGFQNLAAMGAKKSLFDVAEACYVKKDSPLYGCRPWMFAHDEIGMEIPYDGTNIGRARASRAMKELGKVMVASMERFVPDVPIGADGAMSFRWLKSAKPVYREINGEKTLVPCVKEGKDWIEDFSRDAGEELAA